jgi:hypothetical protein
LVIIINGLETLDQHLHSLSDELVTWILSGNDFLLGCDMIDRVGLCMLWVCELTIHLLPEMKVDVPHKNEHSFAFLLELYKYNLLKAAHQYMTLVP